MPDIRLLRAIYEPWGPTFADRDLGPDERMALLARITAGVIDIALAGIEPCAVGVNFASSTILDLAFTYRADATERFLADLATLTPHAPTALLNAYECSGWGYFLRYAASLPDAAGLAVCTIVDANVFDLEFWRSSPHWGRSGFGIAVLVFDLGVEARRDIAVGSARTINKVAEFALAVRKSAAGNDLPVALPFFPQNVSDVFDRTIPGIDRLPDEHARLGHCFGSDPWILALRYAIPRRDTTLVVKVSSIALSGYWAIADVEIRPDARLTLGAPS